MKSEKIYKFYGYRDFDLDAFAGSYLWFSNVKDFNDPFEGLYREQIKFRSGKELTESEAVLYLMESHVFNGMSKKEATQKVLSDLAKFNNPFKYQKGFIADSLKQATLRTLDLIEHERACCCFIRNYEDNQALSNKLMWSHYANGLRGFALEFETDSLSDSFDSNNTFKTQGGVVNYRNLKVVDNYKIMMDWLKGKPDSGVVSVVLTKSPDWEYEQELRIISDTNKMYYDSSIIKSIILGQKMPKEKLNTFMAVIHSLGLTDKVKVATINKKTFNLSIVNFDKNLFE